MSVADIQADKDELRAEFAIKLRKLELGLEKSKDQAARHLVERNRNQVMARQLQEQLNALKSELSARSSQTAVLQQNVSDRIPQLEAQNAAARSAIEARENELNRLKDTIAGQSDALTKAKQELEAQQRAEADRTNAIGHEVDVLQEENKRLVDQMANLRAHLSSADSTALEALKVEKQRIESELEKLKNDGADLDRSQQSTSSTEDETVSHLREENSRLAEDVARLEMQLRKSAQVTDKEVSTLKDEIHKLADQIMDNATERGGSSKPEPAPRSRKRSSPTKSTRSKKPTRAKSAERGTSQSGKASSTDSKPGKESRPSLTQRLREMADSQAD